MAGVDEEVGVALHEVLGHADEDAVGEEAVGVGPEGLDVAKDVVPAAAVEAEGVMSEFVEDLVHLEDGREGFDEDGGADTPSFDAGPVLCPGEDVGPDLCFPVRGSRQLIILECERDREPERLINHWVN